MTIANPAVNKVFNDLDQYRDYCRFEGKVFDERALYKKEDPNWIAYQKYQGWVRAKSSQRRQRLCSTGAQASF